MHYCLQIIGYRGAAGPLPRWEVSYNTRIIVLPQHGGLGLCGQVGDNRNK